MATIQGQGIRTQEKEDAFQGLFRMNLKVHSSLRYPLAKYHHFDLNAGSGRNDIAGCDGSPVVFLKVVSGLGVSNFAAHFVDRDETATTGLSNLLSEQWSEQLSRCTIYNGENREFVLAIPDLVRHFGSREPKYDLGMIVCDPNGTDIPWLELRHVSIACPRLDFLINYNLTQHKRDRGAGYKPDLVLTDHILLLNKRYWLIMDSKPTSSYEWTILVGRNYYMGDWKKMRFYDLKSREGEEMLRRSLSRNEREWPLF